MDLLREEDITELSLSGDYSGKSLSYAVYVIWLGQSQQTKTGFCLPGKHTNITQGHSYQLIINHRLTNYLSVKE